MYADVTLAKYETMVVRTTTLLITTRFRFPLQTFTVMRVRR